MCNRVDHCFEYSGSYAVLGKVFPFRSLSGRNAHIPSDEMDRVRDLCSESGPAISLRVQLDRGTIQSAVVRRRNRRLGQPFLR